jgi:hypothetical protein
MTAPENHSPDRASADRELSAEQGYAEWAYERLDAMLETVLDRENAGIHAAAALALWRMREQRAAAIRAALADRKGLLFGRLDMIDDETWYIGRHSVDGEDGRPAVVDWRTPVGGLFYQATRSFPAGVGRRRSLRMAGRSVTGLSDETLVPGFVPPSALPSVQEPPVPVCQQQQRAALAPVEWDRASVEPVPAEIPPPTSIPVADQQPVAEDPDTGTEEVVDLLEVRASDLLLEDLERERTGELEDVVATIQADQDRLIRAPFDVPLVIQGGPGTGKTIVGLHRAAWVLYEQRARLIQQSVLVVGPNRRFIEYISSVLPSLGETDVRQATIDELAVDSLPAADRARVKVQAVEQRDVARVKGDARMAAVIRSAVWSGVTPKRVSFGYGRFTLRLDEDQVDGVLGAVWRQGVAYRVAKRDFADGLAQAFVDEYVRRIGRRGPAAGGRELRALLTAARSHLNTSRAVAEMFPPVEPRALVQRLYEDRDLLEAAGGGLTPEERALLHRTPVKRRHQPGWTSADLPLLDEAAYCIRGEPGAAGHVVVDEAQDLSPMQWRVLLRRRSQVSMTILGDLAQATSPWSPRSWEKVIERAGLSGRAEVAELRLGYRVPRQVMDFADPLLAAAAPSVAAPHSFRSTVEPVVRRCPPGGVPRQVAEAAVSRLNRGAVAVIAPDDLHDGIMQCLGEARGAVAVLAPELCKGLEFDVVVVAEPSDIAGRSKAGLRLLYVALTRATKELVVVHSRPLPAGIGTHHRPAPPSSYPNPRNDDPWDNDAVHWLLEQPGGERWTRGVLMECLRRQPNQLARNAERVADAARFAKRHGVIQEATARGGRPITRLYRTDDKAPDYPSTEAARKGW